MLQDECQLVLGKEADLFVANQVVKVLYYIVHYLRIQLTRLNEHANVERWLVLFIIVEVTQSGRLLVTTDHCMHFGIP